MLLTKSLSVARTRAITMTSTRSVSSTIAVTIASSTSAPAAKATSLSPANRSAGVCLGEVLRAPSPRGGQNLATVPLAVPCPDNDDRHHHSEPSQPSEHTFEMPELCSNIHFTPSDSNGSSVFGLQELLLQKGCSHLRKGGCRQDSFHYSFGPP